MLYFLSWKIYRFSRWNDEHFTNRFRNKI